MENENNEDNYESFGPHIKLLVGEKKNIKQKFFTVSYKDQDINDNSQFIEWKKTKNLNELIVICPECGTYFTNNFIGLCKCPRCENIFCKGCFKHDCEICFKGLAIALKNMLNYIHIKVYGDHNIFIKILIYFSMLFQLWVSYPLQFIYYFGPLICDQSKENVKYDDKYRRKGLIFLLSMIPYQIAFFGIYFTYLNFFFSLLFIIYPPLSINGIALLWFMKSEILINNTNLSELDNLLAEKLL
jgi:uncharacterized CHY-type Zn-finger protein